MDQELIQAHRDQQAALAGENAKKIDDAFALSKILESQGEVQSAIRQTLQGVVKFLNSYTPEVSVNNQQPFPKYDEVVKAVNQVVTEVKNSNKKLTTVEQKEADYSTIVKGLDRVASLIDKLPKQFPKPIEPLQPIDYTTKFDEVSQAVGNIPAPIVNVEKPIIPDNSKELENIVRAVEKIKFPDIPKPDFGSVEKAVKAVQKSIDSLSFPVPNYVLPFKDINGKAVQAQLDTSGSLPISGSLSLSETVYTTRIDEASATVTYIGDAAIGSAVGSAAWRIKKIDSTSGTSITFADGDGLFNNIWSDRASLSYS